MMKESYVKPLVFFESFSLTQTIARGCGDTHDSEWGESNHYNESTCEWNYGGVLIFFPDHCDDGPDSPEDDYEWDEICYNNPGGYQELFSST